MKDFKLDKGNMASVLQFISKMVTESGKTYRVSIKEWRDSRSLSQNALSHKWYGELSVYLINKGRKDSNPEFCKDLMKHTFLGYEVRVMTDAITGVKTEVSQLKHTSGLDTGEMYHFMCLVDNWAVSIGCMLTVPDGSQYAALKANEHE